MNLNYHNYNLNKLPNHNKLIINHNKLIQNHYKLIINHNKLILNNNNLIQNKLKSSRIIIIIQNHNNKFIVK